MNQTVVAGATGLIGQNLLQQLTASRSKVVSALCRRTIALPHAHQSVILVDYQNLQLEPATDEHSVVICALGTTIKKAGSKEAFEAVDYTMVVNLASQALKQGFKHFVVISSLGADKPGNNFYLQTKHKMESALKDMPFSSMTIVRPSLLLGQREEFRLGEKFAEAASKLASPFLKGALLKYRPIKAAQVSKAILKHLEQQPLGFYLLSNSELHQSH